MGSGRAIMLPRRPTNLDTTRIVLSGNLLDILSKKSGIINAFISHTLLKAARYRLKHCLKEQLNQSNQPVIALLHNNDAADI